MRPRRGTEQTDMDDILRAIAQSPKGLEHKDIVAISGISRSMVSKRLWKMRTHGLLHSVGRSVRTRWCLPENTTLAEDYAESLMSASIARHNGHKGVAPAPYKGIALVDAPRTVTKACQIIVKEWPKARKPGPCSVFDLGAA